MTPRGIDPADATLPPTVERAQPSALFSLLALDPAGVWHMDGVRKRIRITQEGNALIAALEGVPHRSGEVNRRGRIDDARPPSLAADVPGHYEKVPVMNSSSVKSMASPRARGRTAC